MVQHADIDHTGLTGIPSSGAGAILQVVTAVSTANNTTTSTTYQASSLSASITPQAADSKLVITVDGEFNAYSVNVGSTTARLGWVAIQNTTNAVQVVENVRGHSLVAANQAAAATAFTPIALRGIYTVNSTAARTFQLQFKSGEATNVEAAIRGDRNGGAIMTIMEIAV